MTCDQEQPTWTKATLLADSEAIWMIEFHGTWVWSARSGPFRPPLPAQAVLGGEAQVWLDEETASTGSSEVSPHDGRSGLERPTGREAVIRQGQGRSGP